MDERDRAQSVARGLLGPDRLELGARHLDVGLVVERLDLARDALEADDGAGARVAHRGGDRGQVERLVGDLDEPYRIVRAAAHRRDQRDLLLGRTGSSGEAYSRSSATMHCPGCRPIAASTSRARGVIGQVELDVVGAGALTQAGEQTDGDPHGPTLRGRTM